MYQVRGVADQQAALPERLQHQRQVSLLQVANPAVNQLGAPAGSPLGEISLLQQQRPVAAAGRLHRRTEAGGAAADHDHVPERVIRKLPQQYLHVSWLLPTPLTFKRPAPAAEQFGRPPRSMAGVKVRSACQSRPISARSRQ